LFADQPVLLLFAATSGASLDYPILTLVRGLASKKCKKTMEYIDISH